MSQKNWKFRTGLFMVILSVGLFLFLPVIPFMEIAVRTKVTLSTITLIMAEILFWTGGFLLGKELFTRYKSRLHPKNWFRKKDKMIE